MGILIKNIYKRFGNFIAVDDVSFKVNAGELVALLGPSGSGKSTILRIIAGLERPDRGQIFLTGQEVTGKSVQQRQVGFVFQHYALFKHMTAEKNIAFGMEIQKKPRALIRDRVNELVNLVKLQGYEKHYPDQLSGGQRQRVALARALATEPKVLLLDEPFGALDAKVRDNLAQWLKEFHHKLHITSIFVTHDQSEAIEIADKIVVINKGRVEQMGDAREVYEHPENKFVASFIGQVNVVNAIVRDRQIFIKDTPVKMIHSSQQELADGDIVLLVRPEDIEINSSADPDGIKSLIHKIYYRGSHYEIDCSLNDLSIKVIENKNKVVQKQLRENQNVTLHLKSFRIFHAEEGHQQIHEKMKELGYIE